MYHRIVKSSVYKLIKVLLMLLSFAFIFYHVSQDEVVDRLKQVRFLFSTDAATRNYIYAALFLVPVNWFIEALKWKLLTASYWRQSFPRALRGVLTGVAVSFFTPNRTGDFAGRIMLLPKNHRLNGALFSIAGSLAQLLVTVSAGGIAFLLLENELISSGSLSSVTDIGIPVAILILHVVFILMPVIGDRLSQLQIKNHWLMKLGNIRHVDSILLAKVYILSLARYAVFTVQFLLLIMAFGATMDAVTAVALIMISFLLITLIPSFALSELGIRGSVTLFLFAGATQHVSSVLIAATFLWLINIVVPAIAGATGMLYFKIDE